MISDPDTPHKTQVELNVYRFDVFSKNLNWSCVSSMPTHFYHVIGVDDVSWGLQLGAWAIAQLLILIPNTSMQEQLISIYYSMCTVDCCWRYSDQAIHFWPQISNQKSIADVPTNRIKQGLCFTCITLSKYAKAFLQKIHIVKTTYLHVRKNTNMG